jgi:hypothetical protein
MYIYANESSVDVSLTSDKNGSIVDATFLGESKFDVVQTLDLLDGSSALSDDSGEVLRIDFHVLLDPKSSFDDGRGGRGSFLGGKDFRLHRDRGPSSVLDFLSSGFSSSDGNFFLIDSWSIGSSGLLFLLLLLLVTLLRSGSGSGSGGGGSSNSGSSLSFSLQFRFFSLFLSLMV